MSRGYVTSTDHGYAAVLKRVFEFGHPEIAAGILEADGAKEHEAEAGAEGEAAEPVTVIDVGEWAEFGTETEPARSFIRAPFDANEPKMRDDLAKLMHQVISGHKTKEQILELLGQEAVGFMQKAIADGIDPPNAQSTIDAKGSSKPLIASGQLRGSLSYAVRESGK